MAEQREVLFFKKGDPIPERRMLEYPNIWDIMLPVGTYRVDNVMDEDEWHSRIYIMGKTYNYSEVKKENLLERYPEIEDLIKELEDSEEDDSFKLLVRTYNDEWAIVNYSENEFTIDKNLLTWETI